jgi:putative lipoic acid-binding regulatory protein
VPVEDVAVKTRASAAGRFVSMTVDLPVQDGLEVLRIYRLIGDQDEVISYF